jgi:pyruvate carboxylase
MTLSIDTVKQTGKLAEATMCYTGDILSDAHPKYQLAYYVALAKQLVDAGADMIAIKDMAGLLKPQAASVLIGALKDAVSVPIHLHTHDTTGNGIATYLAATHAGVDIVDVAQSSFSGTTSQPSLESLYYALSGDQRQPEVAIEKAQSLDRYFQAILWQRRDRAANRYLHCSDARWPVQQFATASSQYGHYRLRSR